MGYRGRLRRAKRAEAARKRRALMRGRRAAIQFFAGEAKGWDVEDIGRKFHPREIVRHVVVEERDAGWMLAAKLGGPLRDYGLMRGFCVAPGYHEGTRGGSWWPSCRVPLTKRCTREASDAGRRHEGPNEPA